MVYDRGDVIREVADERVDRPVGERRQLDGLPVAVPAVRHQRVEHRLQRHVRLGLEPIDDQAAELFQRPDDLGPVLRRPGVARAHHDYRFAVHVLGQERQWRRELELEDRRELVGRGSRELSIEPQYPRRVFDGWKIGPASTIGPTGCRRYSNDVTMPKLPLPPRTPQNRSGFSFSLAVTSSPSAVTRSTESRLSTAAPYLRINQPIPPPRVSPETPVWLTIPPTVASP